jgi:hypothetical protein
MGKVIETHEHAGDFKELVSGGAVSNFLNHSVHLRAVATPPLAARLPVLEGSDASNKRRYKAGAE